MVMRLVTPDEVRTTVAAVAAEQRIALAPADNDWTVRGVPLAPFPARLRIDDERAVLWHDVVVAEVVPPVAVGPIVEGIVLPRPEVRLMVGEARWLVAISYPLPLDRFSAREVAGLIAAGPMYAAALASELSGHLGKRWRATLEEHGFVLGGGFPHDARDLLRNGVVVPWPDLEP